MKKIYIAGFDVFKNDATAIGNEYKKLCESYGFIGMFPLDNLADYSGDSVDIAKEIFIANKKLIEKSDLVIANLNPFRGKEPDSGTVWECGYAFGLGKKVYGYIEEDKDYIERFESSEKIKSNPINGLYLDSNGMIIEDFDNPFNLMISCSLEKTVIGGFENALKEVKNV